MKTGMRMMAINNARRNRERMEGGERMEYGRMGGYDMRERDPDRMEYRGGYPEARFRDRQGRDHYDNGRYAPQGNIGRNRGGEQRYPYWPPIYRDETVEEPRMNRIGFDMTGRREVEYENGDEMRYRRGRDPQRGMAEHHMMPMFDMEIAREWVEGMHNEDGSTGAHWTMEQVKPIMQQKGVDAEPEEFWAVMNALYSDYCKVAKKHNVSTVDFYADMAKAWLEDKDAVEDKAAAYYEYVVKHD
jgi:hypothetical protein